MVDNLKKRLPRVVEQRTILTSLTLEPDEQVHPRSNSLDGYHKGYRHTLKKYDKEVNDATMRWSYYFNILP